MTTVAPTLEDLGSTPTPNVRYFPAHQRRDPYGWNVVRVISVSDTTVVYQTPAGKSSMQRDVFCRTFASV